jgi:hypothetical protein
MGLAVSRSRVGVLVCALSLLQACGSTSGYDAASESTDQAVDLESAAEELQSEEFSEVGDTTTCTNDCSGHDAGFEWAKENDILDPSDCGGNSRSFEEGCETYAEAMEERAAEGEAEY